MVQYLGVCCQHPTLIATFIVSTSMMLALAAASTTRSSLEVRLVAVSPENLRQPRHRHPQESGRSFDRESPGI